jgi:hypothetical protein
MKKTLILLLIIPLLISCATNPTEKQKEFAHKLLETPSILKTERGSNLTLTVTVDLDASGINPKLQAQQLADQIAASGVEYTGKDICVLIYHGYKNKLADSCLSK